MLDGIKLIEYDCIGSTNAEAKEYARSAESFEPVVFIAREQTAGRGRLGRSFLSRRDRGIYLSVLTFTDGALSDAVGITTRAAVIVSRAIEEGTGNPMKIKWVNDIYNHKGKVAGILAESVSVCGRTAVIVGVGINIGDDDFQGELASVASSIGQIDECGREELIESVVNGLIYGYELDYMREYRKRFMLQDERVELFSAGESMGCGTVLGVDDSGGLIFLADGEQNARIIRTGEVSVRKRRQ